MTSSEGESDMTRTSRPFVPEPGPMRRAIRAARRNLSPSPGARTRRGPDGGPFGACIVAPDGTSIVARNTVLRDRDATCHAEVNAIRKASRRLGTRDLSGCVIYSTTEPCPMCFGAIHWSGIRTVVFGTGIPDARRAGFRELGIPDAVMRRIGRSPIRLLAGYLRDECRPLFEAWVKMPEKENY